MGRVLDGDARLLRDWHARNCRHCIVESCPLEEALLRAFLERADGIVASEVEKRIWPHGQGKLGRPCHEFDPGF